MDATCRNWVSLRWIMIGEESMLWSAIFGDLLAFPGKAPAFLAPLAPVRVPIEA